MILNTINRAPGVPLGQYAKLADTVLRFATAVEDLLKTELSFPFSVGSEALRDCAANEQHLGGATREDRLQRYLNEELDALYRAPWDFTDPDSRADIAASTEDHVAVGATAGLRPESKKNPRDWDAPYLIRSDQGPRDTPPSETGAVRDMFAKAGLEHQQASLPYTLLSAAAHSRFRYAGVSESMPTGRSVNGVPTTAMQSSVGTTAKVTVLAAIATRTHLRALARYANVSEELVEELLRDALAEWCAIGEVPVPE